MWVVLWVALTVAQSTASIPKVIGALTESNCPTTADALIVDSVIRVLVRCHSNDSETVIDLTTVRDIDDREHRILEFTIELCGDVISATGPTGWRVERTPVTRRATSIRWSAPPEYRDLPRLPGGRTERGFRVRAGSGWRFEDRYFAAYANGGVGGSAFPRGCSHN